VLMHYWYVKLGWSRPSRHGHS